MKTIILGILVPENLNASYSSALEQEAKVILQKCKNSMIEYDLKERKWVFNSLYSRSSPKNINLSFSTVKPSSLKETISLLLPLSMDLAKEISRENMGSELKSGNLESSLHLVLNKYCYIDRFEQDGIFKLAADLFIKILMGHYLENGNKRLALSFLKSFLWEMGYYLKWTGGFYRNYSNYKTKVEIFVQNLENKNENDINKERTKIINWIKESVIIGLNWRR